MEKVKDVREFPCHCGCGRIVVTHNIRRMYFSRACNARVHSKKIDPEIKREYYRLYEATMRDKERHSRQRRLKSDARKKEVDRTCKYCHAELPLSKRLGAKFCNNEHSWKFHRYGPIVEDGFIYTPIEEGKVLVKINDRLTVIVSPDKVQATLDKYAKRQQELLGVTQATESIIDEELSKYTG